MANTAQERISDLIDNQLDRADSALPTELRILAALIAIGEALNGIREQLVNGKIATYDSERI